MNAKTIDPESLQGWEPIETAPLMGIILLSVEHKASGERRTFVAEASNELHGIVWQITTGWTGWTSLKKHWTPVRWKHVPQDLTHQGTTP